MLMLRLAKAYGARRPPPSLLDNLYKITIMDLGATAVTYEYSRSLPTVMEERSIKAECTTVRRDGTLRKITLRTGMTYATLDVGLHDQNLVVCLELFLELIAVDKQFLALPWETLASRLTEDAPRASMAIRINRANIMASVMADTLTLALAYMRYTKHAYDYQVRMARVSFQ
jgi:hypothetical protein